MQDILHQVVGRETMFPYMVQYNGEEHGNKIMLPGWLMHGTRYCPRLIDVVLVVSSLFVDCLHTAGSVVNI